MTGFHPYPGGTSGLSRSQVPQFPRRLPRLSRGLSAGTHGTGYGPFRPNKSGHHLRRRYYRGGWQRSCPPLSTRGFLHPGTAAGALPRRHSGSPRRGCPHCGGFAPAAPRRARGLVSVPVSGLRLSPPVPIIGLAGRYPANYLIGRRPILGRTRAAWARALSAEDRSRPPRLSGISPTFAGLSPSRG